MLKKLAFRNMTRSIKDYGVYFLTLLFGVSIFYMFNSIYAQKDMMEVTETLNAAMKSLRQILSVISVFVAVVLGGLIVYANNFFIKRRKKELGIYMTLGMEKRQISTILLLETSIMAVAALLFGLLLGIVGSQFMSFFTTTIFEVDMTAFTFVFAPDAAIKSVLYFAIIFLIVAILNLKTLNRIKLIDLIYGGKKNETMKIRSMIASIMIFMLSVTCLGSSYFLILKNGMININGLFFASIILGTIGTLLFFLSVSGMLTTIVSNSRKLYFKNLNMFVSRQLSSKINTNFLSISVVCIVLLLVIGIFSSGYSMKNVMSTSLKSNVRYDFSLFGNTEYLDSIYDNLSDEIKAIDFEYEEIKVYNSGDELHYSDLNLNYSNFPHGITTQSLSFVLNSDYNQMMSLQKGNTITLENNEYAVIAGMQIYKDLAQEMIQKDIPLTLGEITFKIRNSVLSGQLSNNGMGEIIIVLPDNCKEYLQKISTNTGIYLNISCENSEQSQILNEQLDAQWRSTNSPFLYFISKADIYASSVTTKAIVSFLAIYLGIVFMICCAAILALQQLSEATDNKERYALLHKLGAEKSMINKALFTQIFCYFSFPLLLAVVHSAVGLTAANDVIKNFGKVDVGESLLATAVIVIFVYGGYFCLTYMSSKNIINKK